MLSSIISNIIISVIIVMIIHFMWDYLQNTYFKKHSKTKDLVNIQLQKYKNIIEELQQNEKINTHTERKEINPTKYSIIDEIEMKEDLEKFMESTMNS
jgi:preprotein translocase subunit YajC